MPNKPSFTLIELLIVIGIISILVGLTIVVINPFAFKSQARDSVRIDELTTLSGAISLALAQGDLELISTDENFSTVGSMATDGSGWVEFNLPSNGSGLSNFIPALPRDPLNNSSYYYSFKSDGNKYELNTILESPNNTAKMELDNGDNDNKYEVGSSFWLIN